MTSSFFQKYLTSAQKALVCLSSFSLVLGSFAFLSNPIPVSAAGITADLTDMTPGEVREVAINYNSTDYSSVSFPEIRVQINNSSLEFVSFSAEPCFDTTTNQGIAGRECIIEAYGDANSNSSTTSPTITNNDKIFKAGIGPTSGTLAGTANNTTVMSFCPRSSVVGMTQYTAGGRTTSSSDPSVDPIIDPEACSPADIPNNQIGTLLLQVRAKTGAVNTEDAMRVILRSNNGTNEATTTGYDGSGWVNISMTEFDLTMNTVTAGSVVINEINWAGSSVSRDDQWIELYNTTAAPIDLSGYRLTGPGMINGEVTLPASTSTTCPNLSIPANSYYLISRFPKTDVNTLLNVDPDCVISYLKVWDGASSIDRQINLVKATAILDQTPTGFFPAGDSVNGGLCSATIPDGKCVSMARKINTVTAGAQATSWENSLLVLNEDTGLQNPGANIIAGRKTPKAANRILDITTRTGVYEAENMKVNAGSVVSSNAEGLNDTSTSVKATAGTSNVIVYGPYTTEMNPATAGDPVNYKATFRLAVSDNTNQNVTMGIDVFDGVNGGPLASMQIRPGQFTAARAFQDFELNFKLPQGTSGKEFRLGTNGQGPDIYIDKITVAPSTNNTWVYEAENMLRPMANTTLACNNTCVQNGPTLQDWLLFGPYTRAESAGSRTANFKMKIDNNTTGNEAVIIAVRNATTGVYQTARKVYPQEFTANDTFQDFPMAFEKTTDSHVYEYVAYYDRNWSGRTVSIDKITVQ